MAVYQNINGVIHEVKDIYRNINGVVHKIDARYQNVNGIMRQTYSANTIKKVEFTNPSIDYGPLYLGSEYNAYIGTYFSKNASEESIARKIYDAFKTASAEGYKYYRFYYKNAHEMFMEKPLEAYTNFSATMFTAKIRTNNSTGILNSQAGQNTIYHNWGSGRVAGISICGPRAKGLFLYNWTASAGEKTNWGEFNIKDLDFGGYFDLIGRESSSTSLNSWSYSYTNDITKNMTKYVSTYFTNNNDFVIEFSKTGTET